MPKNEYKRKKQLAQPAQATTQTQQTQVPLVNVSNLAYPDDAYLNVCETCALIEAMFADYGLTEKVDLNKINRSLDLVDQHEKKLEDHQKEIEFLKKRLDSVEAAQAQQPAQPAQAQQATQITQQPAQPAQATQTQFGNSGVTIEQLYCLDNVYGYDKNDVLQTLGVKAAEEPAMVRCFVNKDKAAELTPGQMKLFGFVRTGI